MGNPTPTGRAKRKTAKRKSQAASGAVSASPLREKLDRVELIIKAIGIPAALLGLVTAVASIHNSCLSAKMSRLQQTELAEKQKINFSVDATAKREGDKIDVEWEVENKSTKSLEIPVVGVRFFKPEWKSQDSTQESLKSLIRSEYLIRNCPDFICQPGSPVYRNTEVSLAIGANSTKRDVFASYPVAEYCPGGSCWVEVLFVTMKDIDGNGCKFTRLPDDGRLLPFYCEESRLHLPDCSKDAACLLDSRVVRVTPPTGPK